METPSPESDTPKVHTELPLSIGVASQRNISDGAELARVNGHHVNAGIVLISTDGDVILRFTASHGDAVKFCVDSRKLTPQSSYFRSLLDPSRGFAEAQRLVRSARTSNGPLPVIDIELDVELTSGKASWPKSIVRLANFLRLLQNIDVGQQISGSVESQKVDDLFFLGLCWDRFVINRNVHITFVANVVEKKRRYFSPASFDWSIWSDVNELECRKLIFACFRLQLNNHLAVLTSKLIIMGSIVHKQWLGQEESESGSKDFDSVVWHLPAQLEEEILLRRRTILGRIGSTIDRFIDQYSSTDLQCRFGYGNSNSCDMFQLGQFLRFLDRKSIAKLRAARLLVGNANGIYMHEGSIVTLIKSLRAIPDTQIDANHQHCGVRKDVMPLLELFEEVINRDKCIGICGFCLGRWSESGIQAQRCRDQALHDKGVATFGAGLDLASSDLNQ